MLPTYELSASLRGRNRSGSSFPPRFCAPTWGVREVEHAQLDSRLLEVKKLVKEVGSAPGTFGGRGGGGAPGKDVYGNDLPICKRFGKACYSYQKGIKCSHVAPKQNNGGKGKRKWGKW